MITWYCTNCGANNIGVNQCQRCGAPRSTEASGTPSPPKPEAATEKMPSTISKIYFMPEDLHEFEEKCDLGDFRTIVGALYPHKNHAKDCVVYSSPQEVAALLKAERSKAFEECAGLADMQGFHGAAKRFREKAKGGERE